MDASEVGRRVKELRESWNLSQIKLAEQAGVSRSIITKIENGTRTSLGLQSARKLATFFGVPLENLLTDEQLQIPEPPPKRPLLDLIKDVQEQLEELEEVAGQVEVPVRGYVPAGYPEIQEQQAIGIIEVPRGNLAMSKDPDKVYALKVSGESLSGDGIHSGDYVIIDPLQKEPINGRIFLIRVENSVCIKHIEKHNDHLLLKSSNAEYRDFPAREVEILGRLVRRWSTQEY